MNDINGLKLDLNKLSALAARPSLYMQGEALFWNDDHISKGMLEAHLNPEWEAASRKPDTIRRSCAWITSRLQMPGGASIIDLGCGPGLYCTELSRLGYDVTGIDFSKRSIDYAITAAQEYRLSIEYRYQNYLTLDLENRFDLAVMIYYDLGVLPPADQNNLLQRIGRALKPNGYFVCDLLTPAALKPEFKEWSVHPHGGFWRPNSYIELFQSFNYDSEASGRQHIIIEENGQMSVYRIWDTLYTVKKIEAFLNENGFELVDIHTDLTGVSYTEESETIGIIARKR